MLAIVNPHAGNGRCGRRAPATLERLRAAGVRCEVRSTEGPGHARDLARAGFAEGHRDFVAIGGDGTALEVLNGLPEEALAPPSPARLGLLPLGTGNSFVQHFLDLERAREKSSGVDGVELFLAAWRRAIPRRCDLLRLDHHKGSELVLGAVSLGFAAEVAGLVNRRLKPLGVLGYTVGVLLGLLRLAPSALEAQVRRGASAQPAPSPFVFLSLQNVVFVGGTMRMAPGSDPQDGSFEIVSLDPVSRLELLRAFPRIFRGTHLSHPAVHSQRAERIDFSAPQPLEVMRDGEVARLRLRAVEIVPRALDVWI